MIEVWTEDGKYAINFRGNRFKEDLEEVKESFEGRKFVEEKKCWIAPITPRNTFLYRLHNGENPYAVYDTPLDPAEARRLVVEKGISQELLDKIDSKRKFQWVMISHLMRRMRCINDADMRMGKTLASLLTLKILPFLKNTWFVTTLSAKMGVIGEKIKWGLDDVNFIPMTYDKFTKAMNVEGIQVPQCIIYDEVQYLKDPTTLRYKAAIKARDLQDSTWGDKAYRWGLSGTPAPKDQSEWHPITELICAGYLKESSRLKFKMTLCYLEFMKGQYGGSYPVMDTTKGKKGWKVDAIEAVGKKLKGIVEVFTNEVWFPGYAPPVREIREIPIDSKTKSAIKLLMRVMRGLELYTTCRQLSDGFRYIYSELDAVTLKKERLETEIYDTYKDTQFRLDLDSYSTIGRAVVYAAFTHSVQKLTKIAVEMGWQVLETSEGRTRAVNTLLTVEEMLAAMDASQDDEEKYPGKIVAISQADSMCTGVEFSSSPVIIFYSNTSNMANKKQACHRIDSHNSKYPNKLWVEYQYLQIDKIVLDSYDNKLELKEIPEAILVSALQKDLEKSETFSDEEFNNLKSEDLNESIESIDS